jgi:hypothetical protein
MEIKSDSMKAGATVANTFYEVVSIFRVTSSSKMVIDFQPSHSPRLQKMVNENKSGTL